MSNIKAIAFDLDDTLLDTTRLIVPQAATAACLQLIKAGLTLDLDKCMKLRQELAKSMSHKEIFPYIALHYGVNSTQAIQSAIKCFYKPEVPKNLAPFQDALANILELKSHYSIYLVTSGDFETQTKKIHSMKIEHLFQDIYIVDSLKNEKKTNAFLKIITKQKIMPAELLSFGNRLSSEIRDAKKIGAMTCYFAYGEHFGEIPKISEDYPDFTIYNHKDFISVCKLSI